MSDTKVGTRHAVSVNLQELGGRAQRRGLVILNFQFSIFNLLNYVLQLTITTALANSLRNRERTTLN